MSDPVAPRYRLLLQQAERVLDVQLENFREEVRRTQALIHVGIATIGGTIAVATIIVNAGVILDAVLAGTFGIGILLLCSALIYFVGATTLLGGREAPHGGPDILQLMGQIESEEGFSEDEVFASVALQHVRSIQRNEQIESELLRKRARGLLLLALGVFVELSGVYYIAWGTIFG